MRNMHDGITQLHAVLRLNIYGHCVANGKLYVVQHHRADGKPYRDNCFTEEK